MFLIYNKKMEKDSNFSPLANKNTIINRPVNLWEERLAKQGIDCTILPRYTDQSSLSTKEIDDLTGLPVETNSFRHHTAAELGRCIRDRKPWAIVYADVDNLKLANKKHGRLFGNMVIKYGQAGMVRVLDKLTQINPQIKVTLARASGAADETIVFISDFKPEEMETLKEMLKEMEKPVSITDPPFILSSTSAVIDSLDPTIREDEVATRTWLAGEPDKIPLNFYQQLEDRADVIVGELKIAKDLARLPIDDLLNSKGISQFIKIMTDNLGDSRISSSLLEVICKFTSVQTAFALKHSVSNTAAYQLMLKELGASEEKLRQAKKPEELVAIFEDMFGKMS